MLDHVITDSIIKKVSFFTTSRALWFIFTLALFEVDTLDTRSGDEDGIFSRQGIPDVLKSDNGPPFNGYEFKNFSEYLGFKHRRITPYWPRANGEAERLVQTLQKSIRIAHLEGKNWK